jgi:hypothetical protein
MPKKLTDRGFDAGTVIVKTPPTKPMESEPVTENPNTLTAALLTWTR